MSGLPIEPDALDDRLAFIGTAGSGKTYGAGTCVERLLLSRKAKVVVVDPLGVWWGLRLRVDGGDSAFTLPIFGGAHGDLPLNEHAGKIIGETVASMRESCIVDLSALATKEAERRFMLAFLESLYRKAAGEPMHAVFDEADLWAPQQPGKTGSGPLLQSLMEQIVRRGRVRGFIPWLITQRPAVISKDVLSQADGLIAFKLTSSQDRQALGAWVKGQADEGQWPAIDRELPGMPKGRAVIWLPGRGVLRTADFPQKITFDSSRTPKRGEKRVAHELKPLDLEGLKGRLATVEAEAKANDPTALKSEIVRLKKELAVAAKAKSAASAEADPAALEQACFEARKEGFAEGFNQGTREALAQAKEAVGNVKIADMALPIMTVESARKRLRLPEPPRAAEARICNESVPTVEGVTGPQQRVLNAIAWWRSFGIAEPTSEQVAFMAGYSPSSSGYANLKGAMRSAGLIDYPKGGHLVLTDAGHSLAYAAGPVKTLEAFHDAVRSKLEGPQLRLLNPLIDAYPDALSSDALAEASGYSTTSSGYANLKGRMRTLGFVSYPTQGHVRASDWLFPSLTNGI